MMGMGLGPRGIGSYSYLAPPWQRLTRWSNVYPGNRKYVLPAYASDATVLTQVNAYRGAAPNSLGEDAFIGNYDAAGGQCFRLTDASAYYAVDALGSALSGVKSLSLVMAFQLPRVEPVTIWYVFSFTSSSSDHPTFSLAGAGSGAAKTVAITRRDDTNTAFSTSPVSLNSNPAVVTLIYDAGSGNALFRVNGQTIDAAAALGTGPLTINQFSIGVSRQPAGGGYSMPDVAGLFVEVGSVLGADDYTPLEQYFTRLARFP